MHLNPVPFLALVALSSSVVLVVLADSKLTYTDTGLGPQERQTVIQINGDKVRMGESGSDVYSLYDGSKKILYTINTKTKQYVETTPDKMRERMGKIAELQKQFREDMKKQVAQMPAEQRKVVEARMQQAEEMLKAPPPNVKMEKTDRKETIQGLECTISSIKLNDQVVRDVCISGSDALPADDHKVLLAMFQYMDDIAVESAKAQGMTPPAEGSATLHQDGLPLRIQAVPQGPRSELTALDKAELNDADFALPEGFTAFEPSNMPAAPVSAPAPAAK